MIRQILIRAINSAILIVRSIFSTSRNEKIEQKEKPKTPRGPIFNGYVPAVYFHREIVPTISIIERTYGLGEEKYSRFIVRIELEYWEQSPKSRTYYYYKDDIDYLTKYETVASELKTEVEVQNVIQKFLSRREQGIKKTEDNTLVSTKVVKTISANLPASPEELVEYVNQMSDSDFDNFSALLEQSGRFPLRKLEQVSMFTKSY